MATIPTTYQGDTNNDTSIALGLLNISRTLLRLEQYCVILTDSIVAGRNFWTPSIGFVLESEFLAILDHLTFDGTGDDGIGWCHTLRKRIVKELYDIKLRVSPGGSITTPTYPSDYPLDAVKLSDDTFHQWVAAVNKFANMRSDFENMRQSYLNISPILDATQQAEFADEAFYDGASDGLIHEKRVELIEDMVNVQFHAWTL